jgi:hypothetical protein
VLIGRDKVVRLYGPEGFIEQVYHKLAAAGTSLTATRPSSSLS